MKKSKIRNKKIVVSKLGIEKSSFKTLLVLVVCVFALFLAVVLGQRQQLYKQHAQTVPSPAIIGPVLSTAPLPNQQAPNPSVNPQMPIGNDGGMNPNENDQGENEEEQNGGDGQNDLLNGLKVPGNEKHGNIPPGRINSILKRFTNFFRQLFGFNGEQDQEQGGQEQGEQEEGGNVNPNEAANPVGNNFVGKAEKNSGNPFNAFIDFLKQLFGMTPKAGQTIPGGTDPVPSPSAMPIN